MLRTNSLNLAYLVANGLILLNSTNYMFFSSDMVYLFLSFLLIVTLYLIKIGMKDIIKEKLNINNSENNCEVTVNYVIN